MEAEEVEVVVYKILYLEDLNLEKSDQGSLPPGR
jgi:hypothetical protein